MSKQVKAWAATSANKTEEIIITRRAPDDEDVAIDIKYAEICHSDISTVNGTEVKFPLHGRRECHRKECYQVQGW